MAIIAIIDVPVLTCMCFPRFRVLLVTDKHFSEQTLFFWAFMYTNAVQGLIFIALTVATYKLVQRLNKIEAEMTSFSFSNEKRNVLLTVFAFDFFSLIRIGLAITVLPYVYSNTLFSLFTDLMLSILSLTICDLAPLVFVMLLHRANFKR